MKRHLPWITAALIFAGWLSTLHAQELTPEQKAALQEAKTAYYFAIANASLTSAAFERELSDKAKELRAELGARQQEVQKLQQALKASCPGDLVDDPQGLKPAECKVKVPVPPPGTNGAGSSDVKSADTLKK